MFLLSMPRTKKRGQFYFLAIIIIGTLAVGLIILTNSIKSTPTNNFDFLSQNINNEREYMLDYVVNNPDGLNEQNLLTRLKDFSKK